MTKSGFQVAKIEGIEVLASTGGLIDSFPGDINFENSDDRESFAREARRFGDLLVFRINKGKDRPAMIELGCHWGFYSLLFRKFFPAGVSVLADSDLGSIALAQTNFQLNNLSKIMCWGSIHPIDPNHNVFESGFKAAESCPVPILSFRDTLLPLLKSDVVDIVHMDIQGSELPLLQELEQQGVLSNRIVNLFVATHNIEEHKEVLNLLQKNSFEVCAKKNVL
jgi:FkbM family methyltransferase